MIKTFKRLSLALGVVTLALGLAGVVYAQNTAGGGPPFIRHGPPFGRMDGPGGPLGSIRMMASRLGLTDAQKAQIKGLAESHRNDAKALADRAIAAREALHAAVSADTIDEAAIRQRSADLAAVQADIAVAGAHARAEVFKVLTPEQRAKAKEMQAHAKERVGEGRRRLQRGFGF